MTYRSSKIDSNHQALVDVGVRMRPNLRDHRTANNRQAARRFVGWGERSDAQHWGGIDVGHRVRSPQPTHSGFRIMTTFLEASAWLAKK